MASAKTKVNREELLRQLESVSPGLSSKDIVEQSSCFVFKKGEVLSYNDEVSCRGPSILNDSVEGAVKAEKFLELLRKLPEEEIGISAEGGELRVTGKSRKAGIRMEEDIALSLDSLEAPEKWRKLPDEFTEAVSIVQQCASQDQTSFEMTCIHLHPEWIEACDNFQICRWPMETGFKTSILVRQSSLKHIVPLGVTKFGETAGWLHFKNADGIILSCRKYEEEYRDMTNFLKVKGSPTRLPKALADAAEKAAIFSAENGRNDRILVELKAGRIRVRGEGTSGWYIEDKKIVYDGEEMVFLISPGLLTELTKKYEECSIGPGRLKVKGDKYTYVACLIDPEGVAVSEEDEDLAPPKSRSPSKNGHDDSPIKSLKRKKNIKREEEEGDEEE